MAGTGSVVTPEGIREWGQQLDAVARRIGARFPRSETRDRVRAYLIGLLGPVQRKNAWQVAEQIGHADPYGRIETAQVGVFLAYASRRGTACLEQGQYLPKEWADDPDGCKKACIPEGLALATKIRLARAMLERAFAAGVPAPWVTGDE